MSMRPCGGLLLLAFAAAEPSASLAADQAPASCAGLGAELRMACVETPRGFVLSEQRLEAERVAVHAAAGEGRFARAFGRPAPLYAVIVGDASPARRGTLSARGIGVILTWATQEQTRAALGDAGGGIEGAVREAVEREARARGLGGEQMEAMVQRGLAQVRERGQRDKDAHSVPHELGHLWLVNAFWPATRVDQGNHYGGPGRDWLDETAAMLMEDELTAEGRRRQFQSLYRGSVQGKLMPLAAFLTRAHPMQGVALDGRVTSEGGPRIRVTTRVAQPGQAMSLDPAAVFYLQGRVFADFLLARSNDPAIFGRIAAAAAAGQEFDAWLARHGPAHGLPASLAALETAWRGWLAERFGPPGAASVPVA